MRLGIAGRGAGIFSKKHLPGGLIACAKVSTRTANAVLQPGLFPERSRVMRWVPGWGF